MYSFLNYRRFAIATPEYTKWAVSNFFENSPVSLTPVANLPPVSTTLAKLVEKFAAGVADTGGKFADGVVDTGSNFATGVVDTGGKFATGGAPWLAIISANFRKNSKLS